MKYCEYIIFSYRRVRLFDFVDRRTCRRWRRRCDLWTPRQWRWVLRLRGRRLRRRCWTLPPAVPASPNAPSSPATRFLTWSQSAHIYTSYFAFMGYGPSFNAVTKFILALINKMDVPFSLERGVGVEACCSPFSFFLVWRQTRSWIPSTVEVIPMKWMAFIAEDGSTKIQ